MRPHLTIALPKTALVIFILALGATVHAEIEPDRFGPVPAGMNCSNVSPSILGDGQLAMLEKNLPGLYEAILSGEFSSLDEVDKYYLVLSQTRRYWELGSSDPFSTRDLERPIVARTGFIEEEEALGRSYLAACRDILSSHLYTLRLHASNAFLLDTLDAAGVGPNRGGPLQKCHDEFKECKEITDSAKSMWEKGTATKYSLHLDDCQATLDRDMQNGMGTTDGLAKFGKCALEASRVLAQKTAQCLRDHIEETGICTLEMVACLREELDGGGEPLSR